MNNSSGEGGSAGMGRPGVPYSPPYVLVPASALQFCASPFLVRERELRSDCKGYPSKTLYTMLLTMLTLGEPISCFDSFPCLVLLARAIMLDLALRLVK
jgi:hypothetical protein